MRTSDPMDSGNRFCSTRQTVPRSRRDWAGLVLGCLALGACQAPARAPENPASPSPAIENVVVLPAVSNANTTAPSASLRPREPATSESEAAARDPREGAWSDLAVPDFEPARLWYRPSAPLFVVTHGAGGHAEWHCEHFHRIFAGRVSLLCPRGKRRYANDPAQGYYYPDHHALRREVLRAVERFETEVAKTDRGRPYVYAGYSQGATMGALAVAEHGALFSRLLLVEGGYAHWSNALARQFQRSGGRAVLIVCGTTECGHQGRGSVESLNRAGVRAKLLWAKGAGHVPDGAVGREVEKHWSFLFEGDAQGSAISGGGA